MDRLRILLVNALHSGEYIQTVFPGLGMAYLASTIESEWPAADIRIEDRKVRQALAEFDPEIVAISAVTPNFPLAVEYAAAAKQAGAAVVVGGAHITALPRQLHSLMDVGVIGEGEATFLDLVRRFDRRRRRFVDLDGVAGIVFRTPEGTLAVTPKRPPITPLDRIPRPARHLLSLPQHGVIHVMSSRGCPYRCRFCVSSRFWGRTRYFSPDYVLTELAEVVERYQPSKIFFYDDLFLVPPRRFHAIVERIVALGLNRKIEFNVNCRANLITDEVAAALRRMNAVTANFGFESGSPATLRYLKGGSVTVEDNWRAVRIMRRHGINVSGTFVIGCPEETREDIDMTFRFIRESGLSFFEVYPLTPYPGTPVWDDALEQGVVSESMDWSRLDQEGSGDTAGWIVVSKTFSAEEIAAFLQEIRALKARKRFATWLHTAVREPGRIPRYIRRQLSMAWHRWQQDG